MNEKKQRKSIQKLLEEKLGVQGIQSDYSLELRPDKRNDDEVYLLLGDQPQLESQVSLLMAMRQMLQNFASGSTTIGYPWEEFLFLNPSPLLIQIHWRLKPQPPWEPEDFIERLQLNRVAPPRPYITLMVDRDKVTWQAVKLAAGGAAGRSWGPHYAVAHLKRIIEGGDMAVKAPSAKLYSGTEADAINDLNKLLTLTPPGSYTFTKGEEIQTAGVRAEDPGMRKPVMRCYPAWFTIHNYRLVDRARKSANKARSTALGKLMRKWGQIPLWHNTPPQGVEDAIRELVKRSDDD